jgi:seryl-tRNA synthetase
VAGDDYGTFRQELVDAGLVLEGGTPGLYGRTLAYEEIIAGISGLTTRTGAGDGALSVHFPPVIPRRLLEETGYLKSFPDLIGSVQSFRGDDKAHARLLSVVEAGEDWDGLLEATGVVLRPVACHPVYPLCTGGPLAEGGRRFEIHGWCFRHEPSRDPARMLAFRMHEFVYVGDPEGADAHHELWLKRGALMLESLGLEIEVAAANDPFFGRAGRMLAANQRQEALKFEFLSPITSVESPTAISSVNRHRDHFGLAFGLESADGAVAHSSCFGVGLDRTALALLKTHGLETAAWPAEVRARLWPG